MGESHPACAAIVLAAGMSTRMGRPKMVLPWVGGRTIIEQVVATLEEAGVGEIVVVTGGAREPVEQALAGRRARLVFNAEYANGEMLVSIQAGLRAVLDRPGTPAGVLIALGDQPAMRADTARQVIAAGEAAPGRIIFPSYGMRRGHPWRLPATYFSEVLALRPPLTLRDFNRVHQAEILYVDAVDDSILQDLDTPDEYRQALLRAAENQAAGRKKGDQASGPGE